MIACFPAFAALCREHRFVGGITLVVSIYLNTEIPFTAPVLLIEQCNGRYMRRCRLQMSIFELTRDTEPAKQT